MIDLQIEIFLLLLLGYFLTIKGMISAQTKAQLTNLVIYVVLPAAIIKSFELDITMDQLRDGAAVLFGSLFIQCLYLAANKVLWKKQPAAIKTNLEYATLVSNAGFMGMPIAESLYGPLGLMYASLFLIPQRIFMWSAGLSLYTKTTRRDAVMKVITHPCIIALGIGLIVMIARYFGFYLPGFLDKTINAVAGCNTALCMFVIGAILAQADKKNVFDSVSLFYSFIRLLGLPLLVLGLFWLVKMNPLAVKVCVMETAMPAASTTAMLAAKYDKNPAFASKLIFVSTLFSLITLPFMSFLLELL